MINYIPVGRLTYQQELMKDDKLAVTMFFFVRSLRYLLLL